MKYVIAMALLAAGAAQAGMIGDLVTSSPLINGNKQGSWDGQNSTIVGSGVNFGLDDNSSGGDALMILVINDSSFTLTEVSNPNGGPYDISVNSFSFTDLNQNFAGVSLEAGNTWPAGEFTGSNVSANTIQILMNGMNFSGGANWTATWDVSFASAPGGTAPEPGSIALFGIGIAGLIVWRKKQ